MIQLESTFLKNANDFGYIEALLGGNPTDAYLMNPNDTAVREPLFVPVSDIHIPNELGALREDLFAIIRESAEDETGLTSTLDFTSTLGLIKAYLSEYDAWLREELEKDLSTEAVVKLQNIDTVLLSVEMPDGSKTKIKMIRVPCTRCDWLGL